MKHKDILTKLPLLISKELSMEESEEIKSHLENCPECNQEYQEMLSLEEFFEPISFRKPDDSVWDNYMDSFYNKIERHTGIMLASIGVMIILFLASLHFMQDFILNPEVNIVVKSGLLLLISGTIILLISTLREQLFFRKNERYMEVDK